MTTTELDTQKKENPVIEETDFPVYTPEVDIYTDDSHVYLSANLPGVDAEALDISLKNRVLTITGKQNFNLPEIRSYYREFTKGIFKRSFTLNDELDSENIEANLKNGVLYLTIPKRKPEIKKITINYNS